MNINPINELDYRDISDAVFLDADGHLVEISAAFNIDSFCLDGHVVLAFHSGSELVFVEF
jgi:hypothetical protein